LQSEQSIQYAFKDLLTRIGWIVLIATSLVALYFNLLGGLRDLALTDGPTSHAALLVSTGWQTIAGGALALVSLLMFHYGKKRYAMLAILTLLYFTLTFFLYSHVSESKEINIKTDTQTEQKK
jgi:carbon starvation protein CstA